MKRLLSDGIGTEGSKSSIIRINSLITYFYLGELNFVSSSWWTCNRHFSRYFRRTTFGSWWYRLRRRERPWYLIPTL